MSDAQRIWSKGNRRLDLRRHLGDAALASIVATALYLALPLIAQQGAAGQTASGPTQSPGPRCGPMAQIAEMLSSQYGESAIALGLMGNGNVLQLYSARADDGLDRDGWTIVITSPDGVSCLAAAGTRWETIPVALVGTPS